MLTAALKGNDGPVEIPPGQYLESMLSAVKILLRHTPEIAANSDIAMFRVEALEKRVKELECRLAEQ